MRKTLRANRGGVLKVVVVLRNWFTLTIVSSVIIGLFWGALRIYGALPAEGAQVAYPLLLAYYYGALPVSILLLVIVISVAFWWLPLAMVKRPGWLKQGAQIVLSAGAFGLSVWSAAPLTRVIYRDVAEVVVPGASVRLGVSAAAPGSPESRYVVLVCPGLLCRVTYVTDPTTKFEPLATLGVEGNVAVVRVDDRVVWRSAP